MLHVECYKLRIGEVFLDVKLCVSLLCIHVLPVCAVEKRAKTAMNVKSPLRTRNPHVLFLAFRRNVSNVFRKLCNAEVMPSS